MTKLSKPVSRVLEKNFAHYGRPIVITLLPGSETREEMVAMRLRGTRETYLARVADLYRTMALWHANKLASAKRQAKKDGIKWSTARRAFQRQHTIPKAAPKLAPELAPPVARVTDSV